MWGHPHFVGPAPFFGGPAPFYGAVPFFVGSPPFLWGHPAPFFDLFPPNFSPLPVLFADLPNLPGLSPKETRERSETEAEKGLFWGFFPPFFCPNVDYFRGRVGGGRPVCYQRTIIAILGYFIPILCVLSTKFWPSRGHAATLLLDLGEKSPDSGHPHKKPAPRNAFWTRFVTLWGAAALGLPNPPLSTPKTGANQADFSPFF